jgi:hypothetical protein
MFWASIEPQEVELHMLSNKGYDQNVIGRTFGGFGTLMLDTPGKHDDALFNEIPMVPKVESFERKIANAQRDVFEQRDAIAREMQAQGDRSEQLLEEIRDLVAQAVGQPAQTVTTRDTPGSLADTGEFPLIPGDLGEEPD